MTLNLDHRTRYRDHNVDQVLGRHLPGSPSPIQYDSAVIAGNGIGAQVFAAQLAKSPQFAGKVTIVAPPLIESRRLINGVSLRGVAADFISYALGIDHATLLDTIAGRGNMPVAHRQMASMTVRRGADVRFTRPATWQGSRGDGRPEPILYGVRNSRLVGGIRELLAGSPVTFVDEKVGSSDHLRTFAAGKKPLLVNATTIPSLLGGSADKPKRLVLAVQAPLIASSPKGPAREATAFAPLIRREGTIDVGYFTPFSDPESPRSTWYGIFARVVDADSRFDKEREHRIMVDELEAVAAGMGLTLDDPDETLAKALVPASPWGKIPPSQPGTLDLKRMYSGGAPCFYADGMVSSAIGGVVGAQAVATGNDPDAAIRNALRRYRWHNFLWWVETNKIPILADVLMRVSGRTAMFYPHTAGLRLWRSAA
ncbi:hypothetical protein LTT66_31940 [Nocardia gipuzkoensis]|uniref:hypothetical protein n=1 Tax=Nocardia gipuzkoensis TaxID=2749991 RepID=UPI001E32E5F4|nr:hypothetical protein [Nocardia gipuzkoensis]UGT67756.1 hypothetical protein LTT66_31940 [Nocardia gipuzkoensis]